MSNKALKFRIYPTAVQENFIQKTFGCCRLVYNKALELKQKTYEEQGKSLSWVDINNICTREWKQELVFLQEPDKFTLTNSIINLCNAYTNYFEKRANKPKFKSKKHPVKKYTTNKNPKQNNITVADDFVKLPKVGKLKAVVHRKAPAHWVIKSATVSQEADGSYYVSVLYEYEEVIAKNVDETRIVGLDYKSDGLYTDSKGKIADMPHFYRKVQKRLAKEQRKLSRKVGNQKNEKKSNNYLKQQRRVNKLHRHIANQRIDFLHQKSAEITNQYDIICVEDLNLKSISNKGFGNGKATMDNGYGMFLQFVAYKQADKGHMLIKVDKFYPSSQLCSNCGYKNPELKDLRIRKWICPVCGTVHDRDENAAKNIEAEGLRIYKAA